MYSVAFKDIILITTSRVISKESENAVRRIFYNSLDNIISIMSDPCVAPKNPEAYRSTVLMGRLKQNFPDS